MLDWNPRAMPLLVWRYDGSGNGDDSAHAVTPDEDGNIHVTGRSMGTGARKR
jgi:hypothetical protein